MIRLYAEQLDTQLQEALHQCYFLFGNDLLLLQESQNHIRDRAQAQQFNEHFSITLDVATDWNAIFSLCQARSLFASRQTLLLVFPESGVNAAMAEKIRQLASLLHDDMLLILRGSKLTRATENSAWFKLLSQNAVLVSCATPEQAQLSRWVTKRASSMKLILDDTSCQLLCDCYEGNLIALAQALERLSLLYPDGNLTLPRVAEAVNNSAHFTSFHWIEAVLTSKSKRAAYILRQLRLEAEEPVILLRSIQREILLLLMLKRQVTTTPLRILFDRYNIWQNRRPLLTKALERLTLAKLRDTVALMAKIELALKQNYSYQIWSDLNAVALLLCGKSLPAVMFDV
ncbi:DNA polymerase III subunit delta [Candidatus Doolittlea endobia]|uniref:DNA polymerase III subunit delta n=1 Tax=Candidatus Doolittlea endobia TaxID=1778262 RepID=A0A143WRW2_9ENTR|nr:DNA polymerase III subunit delta [Candidatus Doolittlea endobia]CUX96423.1 DNA polymerase III subunit delta [Candidatus Doolittlea endobia]